MVRKQYLNRRGSRPQGSRLDMASLKRWPASGFTRQVLELLLSQDIDCKIGNTKHFIVVQDVELGDNPLAEEVAIRFRAQPGPPTSRVIYWVSPPVSESGEARENPETPRYQLLVFTFSSSFDLSQNIEYLREFTQGMVLDLEVTQPWFRPGMAVADDNERTLRQVTIVAELGGYYVFQARTQGELQDLLDDRANSVHCIFINAESFSSQLSEMGVLLKKHPEKRTIVAMSAGAKSAEPLAGTVMLNMPFSDEQVRLAISRAFAREEPP